MTSCHPCGSNIWSRQLVRAPNQPRAYTMITFQTYFKLYYTTLCGLSKLPWGFFLSLEYSKNSLECQKPRWSRWHGCMSSATYVMICHVKPQAEVLTNRCYVLDVGNQTMIPLQENILKSMLTSQYKIWRCGIVPFSAAKCLKACCCWCFVLTMVNQPCWHSLPSDGATDFTCFSGVRNAPCCDPS